MRPESKMREEAWLEPSSTINYQVYKDAVITAYLILTGKTLTVDQELKISTFHENDYHPSFAASELSALT